MNIFKILRDKININHHEFWKDTKYLQNNFKRKIFYYYAICGNTVFAVPMLVATVSKQL